MTADVEKDIVSTANILVYETYKLTRILLGWFCLEEWRKSGRAGVPPALPDFSILRVTPVYP